MNSIRLINRIRTDWEPKGGSTACHESVMRSYHILQKVRYYLQEKVPPKIILELIDEMEEPEDKE